MKKTLSIFAAIVLCAAFMPQAQAYDFSATAPTGQTLYYDTVNGAATVVYPNYEHYDYYYDYESPSGDLVIPDSVTNDGITYAVTSIGGSAFRECRDLTSVTIPAAATSIGEDAFAYCSNLISVTIGDSVTVIGESAFEGCGRLTSITIPDAVTVIGKSAFDGCESLSSVTIGDAVTVIGESAFSLCRSLTSITIPDAVTSIGLEAFFECSSLTSVTIGNAVMTIGSSAFSGCSSLTSITIPEAVTRIAGGAFEDCSSLTSIVCKPVQAPTAQESTFGGIPDDCILTIPCGSLASYNSTQPWNSKFRTIREECGTDGIADVDNAQIKVYSSEGQIVVEGVQNRMVMLYDASGHQLQATTSRFDKLTMDVPASGAYMIKVDNQPAKKVMIMM